MKCCKCAGNVSRNTKGLKCFKCDRVWHRTCIFLPDEVFDYFYEHNEIVWTCEECSPTLKSMVDENQKLTKENKDLKKVNSDLLSRLNFLENQMREIKSESISEVLQEVQNKQTHSENNTSSLRGEIFSCLHEERNRESRKLNLCIHNLP